MVVTEYLKSAGLTPYLEALGFHNVGYGCTTCIGNSGPLPAHISQAVAEGDLVACSVLSGNRNFEGRVHAEVRMNFRLATAGGGLRHRRSHGPGHHARPPGRGRGRQSGVSPGHLAHAERASGRGDESREGGHVPEELRRRLPGRPALAGHPHARGGLFDWDDMSTYIRKAPYFDGMKAEPEPVEDIQGARCLALLGDSVTTDHISPAGSIKRDSPGGHFLVMNDVLPADFNSYGSRRGNHEVMMRGTFSNVRLRNRAAPGTEGGFTTYFPTNEVMPIYDAAMQYQEAGIPSSSWAERSTARAPRATGPPRGRACSASAPSSPRASSASTARTWWAWACCRSSSSRAIRRRAWASRGGRPSTSRVWTRAKPKRCASQPRRRTAVRLSSLMRSCAFDTPNEVAYYQHGGILQYVLRQLLKSGGN